MIRATDTSQHMTAPIDDANARSVLLTDACLQLGTRWAKDFMVELANDGRSVVGGWPGTMSEARGRVRLSIDALLTRQRMAPLTHDELQAAARKTYDSAKAIWLENRVRSEEIA